MNFDIFHKAESIKNRTLAVLEQSKAIIPLLNKNERILKRGYRFFRHPIFLMFKCLNVLLLFSPIFLLIYFFGLEFLSVENWISLLVILCFLVSSICVRYYTFHRINSFLIVPEEGLYIFSSTGIFSLNREQIPFDKVGISDLQKSGFWSHILNFGDILLSSIITAKEGAVSKIVLDRVYHPERVLRNVKVMIEEETSRKDGPAELIADE